jgi:predicted nucleic acid-binding protein
VTVLDASAAIEVLLDTELGRRVEARVWGDARSIPNAPHLLDVEVTQVLRRLVRARRLSFDFAETLLADLRSFDLIRHPHGDLLDRALELADNVTAYDGMYLALARRWTHCWSPRTRRSARCLARGPGSC